MTMFQDLVEFLANPLVWKLLIGYWLFNSAVQAMPEMTKDSHPVYKFFYRFLHGFAGNLKSAGAKFNVPMAEEPKEEKPVA
jgi:hypothetical protein